MPATNVLAYGPSNEDEQLSAALRSGRVLLLAIALLDHSKSSRLDQTFVERLVALTKGSLPSWSERSSRAESLRPFWVVHAVDKRPRWIITCTAAFDHPVIGVEPSRAFTRYEAWQWLIARAAWRDHMVRNKGKLVLLQRGQLPAARDYLAKEWRWSSKRVRNFLDQLASAGMLLKGQSPGHYANVITIVNYDKDQVSFQARVEPAVPHGPVIGPEQGQTFTEEITKDSGEGLSSEELYRALVVAAGDCLCPLSKGAGLIVVSEPIGWLQQGADLELDILPAVRDVARRARQGSVRTWAYFRGAVADARARRCQPLPPPRQKPRTQDPLREIHAIGRIAV